MATPRRPALVAALRQRLRRALQIHALAPGDRLPGTRVLAQEFQVDPRVVAAAYQELAAEGLVELRPRSGAYLHPELVAPHRVGRPSTEWLAQLFVGGIARGVAAPALPALLDAALGRTPLRTVAIATTLDQTMGMCRELEQLLGLASTGVLAAALPRIPASASAAECRAVMPRAVQRAQLLVTTEAHATQVRALATRLGRRSVAVTVRADLYDTEWALLKGLDAYVLVVDPHFGAIVESYLRDRGAAVRVHVFVVGRDDLSRLPDDAPVYATQAARERLGAFRLPRGVLPPARMLSDDCLAHVLREVLDAVREGAARRTGRGDDR